MTQKITDAVFSCHSSPFLTPLPFSNTTHYSLPLGLSHLSTLVCFAVVVLSKDFTHSALRSPHISHFGPEARHKQKKCSQFVPDD